VLQVPSPPVAEGVVIRPERDVDHPVIVEVVRTASSPRLPPQLTVCWIVHHSSNVAVRTLVPTAWPEPSAFRAGAHRAGHANECTRLAKLANSTKACPLG
jgi:hypothetical protein